jgi:hypothetical protein
MGERKLRTAELLHRQRKRAVRGAKYRGLPMSRESTGSDLGRPFAIWVADNPLQQLMFQTS